MSEGAERDLPSADVLTMVEVREIFELDGMLFESEATAKGWDLRSLALGLVDWGIGGTGGVSGGHKEAKAVVTTATDDAIEVRGDVFGV